MRILRICASILLICLALLGTAPDAPAQDIREASRQAEADRQAAREEAVRAEQEILADRERLQAEVLRLEQEQAALEQDVAALQRSIADNGGLIEGRAISPNFGNVITLAGPPRTIEMGLKLGY